jgi:putative membrane protein
MTARNLYLVVFAWLAIAPLSRTVWIAEVIPVVIVFAALALSFPAFRFSNTAYSLMAVWLFWHTVGGHYTFANVPFGWVSELLGTERNHFDRIGHFSVGLYAFPMMEWLLRRRHCGTVTAGFFAVFFIMSIAAAYEIVEWWFAVVAGGDAGVEFLGAQGDIWDAQKDMLADTLGAILAVVLYLVLRPDQSRR